MKKFVLLISLLVIFSPLISAMIRINEVELNPQGYPDTGKEWIELYSEQEVNLTNWTIMASNGRNISLNISFSEYYILMGSYNLLTDNDNKLFLINNNGDVISETINISDTSNDNRTWQYCNLTWIFEDSTKEEENLCLIDSSNNNQTNQTLENKINQTDNQINQSSQTSKINESSLYFETERSVEFEGYINIELDVYRGDTSKYALYVYIENNTKIITEKLIIHLNNKFTNYSFQIPVYIKEDCKYSAGEYQIIIEGLDSKEQKDIEIKRDSKSSCVINTTSKNQTQGTTKTINETNNSEMQSILNEKNLLNEEELGKSGITGRVIYIGDKRMTEKNVSFLLLSLLFCLLIYGLIKKRNGINEEINKEWMG